MAQSKLEPPRLPADTIPDDQFSDESGIQLVQASVCLEDRRRLQGLLGGRFQEMCRRSREGYAYRGLFPNEGQIARGHPRYPDDIDVAESFSESVLEQASEYDDPALVLLPPYRYRHELIRLFSDHHTPDLPLFFGGTNLMGPEMSPFYRPYIVEGSSEMLTTDRAEFFDYPKREKDVFDSLRFGEGLITRDLYALLALQHAARGSLLDLSTFTYLDPGWPVEIRDHSTINICSGPSHVSGISFSSVRSSYVPVGQNVEGQTRIEWRDVSKLNSILGRFRKGFAGNPIRPKQ